MAAFRCVDAVRGMGAAFSRPSTLTTCSTLTLPGGYWVNDATRQAFRKNFDGSALALFQAFQVLLTLNLYVAARF